MAYLFIIVIFVWFLAHFSAASIFMSFFTIFKPSLPPCLRPLGLNFNVLFVSILTSSWSQILCYLSRQFFLFMQPCLNLGCLSLVVCWCTVYSIQFVLCTLYSVEYNVCVSVQYNVCVPCRVQCLCMVRCWCWRRTVWWGGRRVSPHSTSSTTCSPAWTPGWEGRTTVHIAATEFVMAVTIKFSNRISTTSFSTSFSYLN